MHETIYINDSKQRSLGCAQIIKSIPEWFGQEKANATYEREIADKNLDVFGILVGAQLVGVVAIKYHFDTSAEIWWMGVHKDFHRQGIGSSLVKMAKKHVRSLGYKRMVLMTLNPTSDDAGYAATRAFYIAQGFEPLVAFNEDDPLNPMMWMLAEV